MPFAITSAKLTGNPGNSGWAQVHEYKPEEPDKLASRGHLFAVIATGRNEEGVDSVIAGRELLARLHEEYFGKEEGEPFNVLKTAVEKVISEFKGTWGEVEIAAVAILDKVVYSAVGDGGQVAIFRNGMLAKILESAQKEVVSASGYPKDRDILLLGTKRFFEAIPNGIIKASLESGEPGLAAESLAPSVHAKAENGNLGAAIIKFEKETVFVKETPRKEDVRENLSPVRSDKLGSAVTGARRLFGGFLAKIESVLSKRLPERRIYVRGGQEEEVQPSSKKTTLTVGIILLAILFVSIGFGIRQKSIKEAKGKYQDRLTQAQHQIDEAVGLAGLNADRARELFTQSKTTAESLKAEGVKDSNLNELLAKLDANQGAILGEYRVEPQLYLDLSILSDGLTGDDLSGSSGKIFILDKNGKKIVGVSLPTKKTEVVAGPDQTEGAIALASYEDRVFILTQDGLYEVGTKRTEALAKDWQGDVLPYAYAGNLYVLDKGAGMIWRFPGTGETFSSKQKWLGPGVTSDFSNVNSLTIDGSIWVLTKSGKILKFTQGSPQSVSLSGVYPEIASADAIYTNETLGYVYILDKQGRRVLVLDKKGAYKAQYISDNISEATDIAVSEKDKKIILLGGSRLYSIEIKHL